MIPYGTCHPIGMGRLQVLLVVVTASNTISTLLGKENCITELGVISVDAERVKGANVCDE